MSATARRQASSARRTSFSPSSIRLAISTSPSRVSSETEPILRRYRRTGSFDLPPGSSSSSFSSSSSTSLAWGSSEAATVGLVSEPWAAFCASTISMSLSPNIDITSSI